ncbi:MAG TPA: bifunctional phosphoserine phosphatase/homoserine phosphotransferase ThrH [Fibrobacteraceae bacterium]|nr:bifunctional phosphoserine phosphatase/homoserine phosphotransferase ThrH [Fibrobacteraceae bacterium]
MFTKQCIVTLDLEGVLVPEVWIAVAERTGIEELHLTTRDIPDYDILMKNRLAILARENLTLPAIQDVIGTLQPLEGAKDFLDELKTLCQVVILSDTFQEFAWPLMKKLDFPTLFCHNLVVENDVITGYQLRMKNQKAHAVEALRGLNFKVTAVGDSYNDTGMLKAANQGVFFRAPENVIQQFPQFPVTHKYTELLVTIRNWIASL